MHSSIFVKKAKDSLTDVLRGLIHDVMFNAMREQYGRLFRGHGFTAGYLEKLDNIDAEAWADADLLSRLPSK